MERRDGKGTIFGGILAILFYWLGCGRAQVTESILIVSVKRFSFRSICR